MPGTIPAAATAVSHLGRRGPMVAGHRPAPDPFHGTLDATRPGGLINDGELATRTLR